MGENQAVVGSSDDSDFEDPQQNKGGSPGRKSSQSEKEQYQKAEEGSLHPKREEVGVLTSQGNIITRLRGESPRPKHRSEGPGQRRYGKYNCQEDQAIRELVKQYGTKRWSLIALKIRQNYEIQGRSGKQCRERWHNHLDPNLRKDPLSSEEEKVLFEAHRVHGNKWAIISKLLPGRSDNSIKNHFYSTLRRHLRKINKGLKNEQMAQLYGLKQEELTAEHLYRLMKENKVAYEDISDINTQKMMRGKQRRFTKEEPLERKRAGLRRATQPTKKKKRRAMDYEDSDQESEEEEEEEEKEEDEEQEEEEASDEVEDDDEEYRPSKKEKKLLGKRKKKPEDDNQLQILIDLIKKDDDSKSQEDDAFSQTSTRKKKKPSSDLSKRKKQNNFPHYPYRYPYYPYNFGGQPPPLLSSHMMGAEGSSRYPYYPPYPYPLPPYSPYYGGYAQSSAAGSMAGTPMMHHPIQTPTYYSNYPHHYMREGGYFGGHPMMEHPGSSKKEGRWAPLISPGSQFMHFKFPQTPREEEQESNNNPSGEGVKPEVQTGLNMQRGFSFAPGRGEEDKKDQVKEEERSQPDESDQKQAQNNNEEKPKKGAIPPPLNIDLIERDRQAKHPSGQLSQERRSAFTPSDMLAQGEQGPLLSGRVHHHPHILRPVPTSPMNFFFRNAGSGQTPMRGMPYSPNIHLTHNIPMMMPQLSPASALRISPHSSFQMMGGRNRFRMDSLEDQGSLDEQQQHPRDHHQ